MIYAMTVFMMLIKSSVVMSASDTMHDDLWVDGPEPQNATVQKLRDEFLELKAESAHFRDIKVVDKDIELTARYNLLEKCFLVWDAQELKNSKYDDCVAALVKWTSQKFKRPDDLSFDERDWSRGIADQFRKELHDHCKTSRHIQWCQYFGIPTYTLPEYSDSPANKVLSVAAYSCHTKWEMQHKSGSKHQFLVWQPNETVTSRLYYFCHRYGAKAQEMLNAHIERKSTLRKERYAALTHQYIVNKVKRDLASVWNNDIREVVETIKRNRSSLQMPQVNSLDDFAIKMKTIVEDSIAYYGGGSPSNYVGNVEDFLRSEHTFVFGKALDIVEIVFGKLSIEKRAKFLGTLYGVEYGNAKIASAQKPLMKRLQAKPALSFIHIPIFDGNMMIVGYDRVNITPQERTVIHLTQKICAKYGGDWWKLRSQARLTLDPATRHYLDWNMPLEECLVNGQIIHCVFPKY